MSKKKEFSVPQEEVEKLKTGADAASKFVLAIITASVLALIGVVAYWTQIEGKDLPMKINVDVEEAHEAPA